MLLILSPVAQAIDWDDGGDPDQDWSNALNWAGDVEPTAADNVRIGSFDAEITQSGEVFNAMFLGDPFDTFGGTATLTMTAGDLTGQNIRIGTDNSGTGTGGDGTFTFVDGTITLNETANIAQAVEIGRSVSAFGEMIMGDGTTNPMLSYAGGRFEVGQTGTSTSTFTFNSGTVSGTDNLIIGQGNGIGVATMTVGGSATPAIFTTTTDLNMNNQDASLTIDSNGTVEARDLQFASNGARTTSVTVNTGGTLVVRDDMNDRGGKSIFNIDGGSAEFRKTASAAGVPSGTREAEQLGIGDGSTLTFHLGAPSANSILPILVAGDDTPISASINGTVTFATVPGNFNNSGTIDTWTASSATWDTLAPNQSQWDLGVSPDRLAGGIAYKLIDSPTAAITGTSTLVATPSGAWTVSSTANDVTLTSVAGLVPVSPRAAVFNDSSADVVVGASPGDDLIVGRPAANASALDIIDVNSFAVTDDLVIGGEATAIVNIGTAGGGSAGGMTITVGDDIVFGDGATQGGTINLYEGTLAVGGTIIEGSDDPDTPDSTVNSAQLQIDGGTLTVAGNAITVQRFAVGQAAGTTGSYTQAAGTITHSGTAAIGSAGSGTLTLSNVTMTGGNVVMAESGGAGSFGDVTLTDSSWSSTAGTWEQANSAGSSSTVILNGASAINNVGGDFRVADFGTGVLTVNGTSTVTQQGGNFETAETASSNGTLNMNGGTITLNSNNFILGQSAGSTMALNMNSGLIDLLPSGAAGNDGNMNCNGGIATITMTGGIIKIGEDLLGGNNAASVFRWNQSAGEVLINDALDYRDEGDDQIVLSGTATVKLGQEAGRDGNLNISNASTVGTGVGGNVLKLVGGNVTFEMIDGAANNLIADNDSTLNWEFDGSGVSPIVVGGNVTLNDAALLLTGTLPSTGSYTLIDGGAFTVYTGSFFGLPEGAYFTTGGQNFQITYAGGDGFDTVVTPVGSPVVTIAAGSGEVVEGASASFTVSATPAPSGGNITVNLAYSGTATDGSDYTSVASVDILDGNPTASFSLPTVDDGIFEGGESIMVGISSLGGVTANIGVPGEAGLALLDGNSAPVDGPALTQTTIGAVSPVALDAIVLSDEAGGISRITGVTDVLAYGYNGLLNFTQFGPGWSGDDDDGTFTLSPIPNSAFGYSLDVEFTPTAADVSFAGVNGRCVWESGGSSNGSGVYLISGVPHFIAKMNGGNDDAPSGLTDTDWADNCVCVPLKTGLPLVANERVQIALIFDRDSVQYSFNGGAPVTVTLTNRGTRDNWMGTPNTDIGTLTSSQGGLSADVAAANFYIGNYTGLENGGGAVSTCRFWNSTTGSISNSSGSPETIDVTLTIRDWGTDGGSLSTTGGGSFLDGVWNVSGDLAAVNAALAATEFTFGTGDPAIIDIAVDDQTSVATTSGVIIVASTAPTTVYVDDDFGAWGTTVTDVDDGTAAAEAGLVGYDAFSNFSDAIAGVDATGTIVANDGDYSVEVVDLTTDAPEVALELTGSGGSPGGSTVTIGSLNAGVTNSLELDSNTLALGNDSAQNVIACAINGFGGNLTKNGSDRLVLQEVCNYTGTTTVNDGFLRVGGVAEVLQCELAGDGPVIVNSPAVLEFNVLGDGVISQTGAISGDGKVLTMDDGTLIFDGPGANTFSGGFELGDGATSSYDFDTVGTPAGARNGFVVVNRGDHLGTGKILSRGAQLQAGSPGIVIPNDIDIDAGGFRCGGSIDFAFSGQINPIGNTARGYGNYGLEGLDLTITAAGGINLDGGQLNVEGSNGKDNGTWTFDCDIDGTGNVLVQNTFDNGVAIFSGTNTYSGTTTLAAAPTTTYINGAHDDDGGTLILGNYAVNAGTTLGGSGSIDSLVIVNDGGTLAPGAGLGMLSVEFGVDLADNSTFSVEVDTTAPTPSADLLVSNDVIDIGTLTGAILDVSDIAAVPTVLTLGTKLTIIDYSGGFGGLNGEFAGLPDGTTFSAGVNNWTIAYDDGGSQTVTLTAAGASSAYTIWASGFPGLTGGFDDDDDGDGVPNGLEWYFFNTDPRVAQSHASPLGGGPGGPGSYTHLRPVNRTGATETYQWSLDLVNWYDSGQSDGTYTVTLTPGTPVPAADPDYESVTVTVGFTGSVAPKGFSRLVVSFP